MIIKRSLHYKQVIIMLLNYLFKKKTQTGPDFFWYLFSGGVGILKNKHEPGQARPKVIGPCRSLIDTYLLFFQRLDL